MNEPSYQPEARAINQLREETLQKLTITGREIVEEYVRTCSTYGINPGITRLFAVGSIVKNRGTDFGSDSDVDLIFSVEHPETSLSSIPWDASSRSEAEDEREHRHIKALEQFEVIWERHGIALPLNVPHGESMPEVWGLSLCTSDDFPIDRPAILVAEFDPSENDREKVKVRDL